eukprot:m.13522 g.13522  ORF g.13522 m.13522 type:complete len:228 (-) comp19988_c0_seq2:2322-3005(-)
MFGDKEVQQLCDAVASDSLHDCQQIVRSCGMLIVTADFFGSTALHNAAAHGRLLILQWFLDLHLLVNTLDSFGQTALMVAARYGRTECVRALLAAGADRRLWDEKGLTALYHAVQRNHEDIVAILAEHERSYDPVGSRTKRASREPAAPIQQAEESLEDLPIIAVFNDLSVSADETEPGLVEGWEVSGAAVDSGAAEYQPLHPREQQHEQLPPMVMDLGVLDFELPN